MIRFLTVVFLVFILYLVLKKVFSIKREYDGIPKKGGWPEERMVKDPECGIYLPVGEAIVREFDGREFYFCSDECASQYQVKQEGRQS